MRPYLKKKKKKKPKKTPLQKKAGGGVVQGVGPEFKPQYLKEKVLSREVTPISDLKRLILDCAGIVTQVSQ
jgi:hypothetical protein